LFAGTHPQAPSPGKRRGFVFDDDLNLTENSQVDTGGKFGDAAMTNAQNAPANQINGAECSLSEE